MTLIEVMIVLIIVAMAASGITYSLSAITRANLRSACMTLTAAYRYAYNRSISRGDTIRVVLNMDDNQISFEEGHGQITLARVDDATRGRLEDGEDQAAVDPWAAARARLESTLRPSFGASPFHPIEGRRYQARPIGSGVTIERLFAPHEPEPRTQGPGAVYFFPGGQTEHAIVWLSDGDDRIYSVELHPLTGRTKVHNFAYEPEHLLDDGRGESRSEVED